MKKKMKRKKKKRECLEGFGDEGYDTTTEQRRNDEKQQFGTGWYRARMKKAG